MTTANKVTIARIFLVPVFIVLILYYIRTDVEWFRFWAIICFAIASIADGLDGYIARHYNQRSELGAVLDPLADKLLLVSAIVLLSLDSHSLFVRFPLWLTGIIIGRDLIVLLGLGVIRFMVGKVTVRPRLVGKAATVLQMAAVLWTLLRWDAAALRYLTSLAGIFTGLSGVLYVLDGVRQLNAHPSSAPAPRQ